MSYIPNIAFLAGSVGAGEWVMLFAVVLVVVGPRRLPEVARKLGRTMEMFRRAADEFKEQLMNMDQEIKTTVADASSEPDVDGVEGENDFDDGYDPSDDYNEGDHDDFADYPGNEDMVAEQDSDSEKSHLESDGDSDADAKTGDASGASHETPDAPASDDQSETVEDNK